MNFPLQPAIGRVAAAIVPSPRGRLDLASRELLVMDSTKQTFGLERVPALQRRSLGVIDIARLAVPIPGRSR
jgi:hypothetical protein